MDWSLLHIIFIFMTYIYSYNPKNSFFIIFSPLLLLKSIHQHTHSPFVGLFNVSALCFLLFLLLKPGKTPNMHHWELMFWSIISSSNRYPSLCLKISPQTIWKKGILQNKFWTEFDCMKKWIILYFTYQLPPFCNWVQISVSGNIVALHTLFSQQVIWSSCMVPYFLKHSLILNTLKFHIVIWRRVRLPLAHFRFHPPFLYYVQFVMLHMTSL